MYNLPYFKEDDKQTILQFLHDHPFAFLTGSDSNGKQVATQIPILVEERDGEWYLQGHFMRNTDHHKTFEANRQVLALFTGPHAYVSASWYTTPQIGSTWNYMSVHVKGTLRFVDEKELEDILRVTSSHFEEENPQSATVFDNLPENFRQKAIQLIAGFEIEIKEIDTVFKLSQDRNKESYHNIIKKLRDQDDSGRAIAAEMEKRTNELFPDN